MEGLHFICPTVLPGAFIVTSLLLVVLTGYLPMSRQSENTIACSHMSSAYEAAGTGRSRDLLRVTPLIVRQT